MMCYIIDKELDKPFYFCKFMNEIIYFIRNFCVNKYLYVFEQYRISIYIIYLFNIYIY